LIGLPPAFLKLFLLSLLLSETIKEYFAFYVACLETTMELVEKAVVILLIKFVRVERMA